jgi:hypothetical protein
MIAQNIMVEQKEKRGGQGPNIHFKDTLNDLASFQQAHFLKAPPPPMAPQAGDQALI